MVYISWGDLLVRYDPMIQFVNQYVLGIMFTQVLGETEELI